MSVIQRLLDKAKEGDDSHMDTYLGNVPLSHFIKDLEEFAEEIQAKTIEELLKLQ